MPVGSISNLSLLNSSERMTLRAKGAMLSLPKSMPPSYDFNERITHVSLASSETMLFTSDSRLMMSDFLAASCAESVGMPFSNGSMTSKPSSFAIGMDKLCVSETTRSA